MKRRKNTIFSPEKPLVSSQKYEGLVHLDIVDYLTTWVYTYIYMQIYPQMYVYVLFIPAAFQV